jgi:hypothetical protein
MTICHLPCAPGLHRSKVVGHMKLNFGFAAAVAGTAGT